MKLGDITCRKCGRDASQIKGWLQRVNPKGEPMVAECRPACYPLMITNEQAVIGAISGDALKEAR